jgi:alpha-galactosidase
MATRVFALTGRRKGRTMETSLEVSGLRLAAHLSGHPTVVDGGLLLPPGDVSIEHPFGSTLFYRNGWTSWSPTAWRPLAGSPLRGSAVDELPNTSPNDHPRHRGHTVGALDGTDSNVLLLGGLGIGVARVESDERILKGWFEDQGAGWFLAYGPEEVVFARYADLLTEHLGSRGRRAGNVWCSWYSYFEEITEPLVRDVVDGLDGLPFDIIQIDDGWQPHVGDWQAGADFPNGMAALASHIRDRGFRPGLWLAPFIASADSRIFHDRRHLFLHDSQREPIAVGHNWGAPYYAFDTTLPEAMDHIVETFQRVMAWEYDYLKLDFMFAGAFAAPRARAVPREQAYRDAVTLIREVVGDDTYLLGCGVPLVPSMGIFDGVRVGPDTAPYWYNRERADDFSTPGARNALLTSLHRLWLRAAFEIDPDVVYFRTRYNLLDDHYRRYLVDLAELCDFRGTSDPPKWLDANERAALEEFLTHRPQVIRKERYRFTIDGRDVDFWPAIAPERHISDRVLVK